MLKLLFVVLFLMMVAVAADFSLRFCKEGVSADDAFEGVSYDVHRVIHFIKTRVKAHQLRSVVYDPYFNEGALREDIAALHFCKYFRYLWWSSINKNVICLHFRVQGVGMEYRGDPDSFGRLIAQLLQDQYTAQYGHLSYPFVYYLSFPSRATSCSLLWRSMALVTNVLYRRQILTV